MVVDKRTPLTMVLPFLTEERLARMLEQVTAEAPHGYPATIEECTLAELGTLLNAGDEPLFLVRHKRRPRALEFLAALKWTRDELARLTATIERYAPPLTPAERAAHSAVEHLPTVHAMIADCVEWFRLGSTDAALSLHVYDWLVMYRRHAEGVAVARRLARKEGQQ